MSDIYKYYNLQLDGLYGSGSLTLRLQPDDYLEPLTKQARELVVNTAGAEVLIDEDGIALLEKFLKLDPREEI